MFNKQKCIPCQGGIPPMTNVQILVFKKLVNDNWTVNDSQKIIREFKFDTYLEAIKFSNLVSCLIFSFN